MSRSAEGKLDGRYLPALGLSSDCLSFPPRPVVPLGPVHWHRVAPSPLSHPPSFLSRSANVYLPSCLLSSASSSSSSSSFLKSQYTLAFLRRVVE
ncbi:hypothetical protein E2C01_032846 [Portunus trituberculatus]|uniref:Uncharacterized protein n=1 Tax=Portunus trituberculatus TaxID=210409 RepID=A0A5B7F402_PORTR|nr:hypothetical protein [Portunus trituberculatus]